MHREARREWESLLPSARLVTTNYVLLETAALLQNRIGLDAVRAFAADVLPILDVEWVDEPRHRAALESVLTANRRGLSLVDCLSFQVMRELGLEKVFCFDAHFGEQGFQTVP